MTLCAPWLTTAQLGDCGCTETPNPTVLTESILAASEVLYQLSGRQYPGICEGQVRPCGDPCRCFFDDCGCNRLPKAFLRWDVLTVTEVDIAGVILEPDAYRVEAGFWSVWMGGRGRAARIWEPRRGKRTRLPSPLLMGRSRLR
jgi:hypothetical protein